MELSKHNILTQIHGDSRWLIANLLSGQADILEPELGEKLSRGEIDRQDELSSKGYLVEPEEENKRYRRAYLDFVESRESDEIQIFYAPTYACNFGCSYCFQDEYAPAPAEGRTDNSQVMQAFFRYIDTTFADRRKYVTLFGGEPLLLSPLARQSVDAIVEGTQSRGLDLAVVTNGYNLAAFVPTLKKARIREIQVTLDGTEKIHDQRRYLKGGGETFRRVVEGVDAALAAGFAVNLRAVLDRDNVESFGQLAHFAIDRGWTKHEGFKTQIGRNYELHHCQSERSRLYTRLSLYQDLHKMISSDPAILEFHKPAFSVSKFLFERGELPDPLFDACPACKTEWAFDYTGRIYPCTANVGKAGEAVGTFYPEVKLDPDLVEPWEERDVAGMPGCQGCSVQLACGGGCGAVSKNREGRVDAKDCRPVRELLSLGCSLYGKEALAE